MSGNPGCAPCAHRSCLQPMYSEPSTPGRYQPYSTGAKRKMCTRLLRLMHPGARILLHVCAFCLWAAAGRSYPNTQKAQVRMSSAWELESLLCLTHWILTRHLCPVLFSFISVVCLQYGICREGLFLSIDKMPSTRREGVERKSWSQFGPLGNFVL